MFFVSLARKLAAVTAAALCQTMLVAGDVPTVVPAASMGSPTPESVVGVLDGWRRAEAYAKDHPGCEVFVGRGDSMLPLYRDRTVLVVQTVKIGDLRAGMTVVFVGDRGALVAHRLLEKTLMGWRAMGVGNDEADRTRVRRDNLVGVVLKAYAPALPGSVVALQ